MLGCVSVSCGLWHSARRRLCTVCVRVCAFACLPGLSSCLHHRLLTRPRPSVPPRPYPHILTGSLTWPYCCCYSLPSRLPSFLTICSPPLLLSPRLAQRPRSREDSLTHLASRPNLLPGYYSHPGANTRHPTIHLDPPPPSPVDRTCSGDVVASTHSSTPVAVRQTATHRTRRFTTRPSATYPRFTALPLSLLPLPLYLHNT